MSDEELDDPYWADHSVNVIEIADLSSIPDELHQSTKYFSVLLASPLEAFDESELRRLIRRLVDAGARYFCAYGPNAEAVHDVIDRECIDGFPPVETEDSIVMTTWHTKTVDDAVFFWLFNAYTAPDFQPSGARLAIVLDEPAWAQEISELVARYRVEDETDE